MEIVLFDKLDSTQQYLLKRVKEEQISNIAVVTKKQSQGVGSRGNSWIAKEGDLLFSFVVKKEDITADLPISSASIYFGYLFKELLKRYNKDVYLKWPNDIYLGDKKCGGVITNLVRDRYVVGIGLNLVERDDGFGYIKELKEPKSLLESYFLLLRERPKWKEILTKFRLEFKNSLGFKTHIRGRVVELRDAILCEDGSIIINNERVYSLR